MAGMTFLNPLLQAISASTTRKPPSRQPLAAKRAFPLRHPFTPSLPSERASARMNSTPLPLQTHLASSKPIATSRLRQAPNHTPSTDVRHPRRAQAQRQSCRLSKSCRHKELGSTNPSKDASTHPFRTLLNALGSINPRQGRTKKIQSRSRPEISNASSRKSNQSQQAEMAFQETHLIPTQQNSAKPSQTTIQQKKSGGMLSLPHVNSQSLCSRSLRHPLRSLPASQAFLSKTDSQSKNTFSARLSATKPNPASLTRPSPPKSPNRTLPQTPPNQRNSPPETASSRS